MPIFGNGWLMLSRTVVDHSRQPEPSPDYRELIGQERDRLETRLERIETRLGEKIDKAEERLKEETNKAEGRLKGDLDDLRKKVERIEPKVWMMWGGIALAAAIAAILARIFT